MQTPEIALNTILTDIRQIYDKRESENDIFVSRSLFDILKTANEFKNEFNFYGIEIKENSFFPFTMEDGSICHGVLMPKINLLDADNHKQEIVFFKDEKPVTILPQCFL